MSESGTISRRDFLKLGAAAIVGVVGGKILELSSGENPTPPDLEVIPLPQIDLVNNPEYFVGEPGREFAQKILHIILNNHRSIYQILRNKVIENSVSVTGDWDEDSWVKNLGYLLEQLKSRALEVVYGKRKKYKEVLRDLESSYYEVASYIQMLLALAARAQAIGDQQFANELFNFFVNEGQRESIANLLEKGDAQFIKNIFNLVGEKRTAMAAVWNYNWEEIAAGQSHMPPIGDSFFYHDASPMSATPFNFVSDPFSRKNLAKPKVEMDEFWPHRDRPAKTEITSFDHRVAEQIKRALTEAGLERLADEIKFEQHAQDGGITHIVEDKIEILIRSRQPISIEYYESSERQMLHKIFHEVFHSLAIRSRLLSRAQLAKLRNLELSIWGQTNPLRDPSTIFGRDGDFIAYSGENDFSLYNYYLEHILEMHTQHNESNNDMSIYSYLNDFLFILRNFFDNNINHISLAEGNDLNSIFFRLKENDLPQDTVSNFFAKVLIKHELIISKKRPVKNLLEYQNKEIEYYPYVVLPFIFLHIMLFKLDDLLNELKKGKTGKSDFLANYLVTLQKRLSVFVGGLKMEEGMAELFSEAMLTKKYGEHPIQIVNNVKPLFEEIIELLKDNSLA